jgi:hypothetical protein
MARRDIAGLLTGVPSNFAETMLRSGQIAGDVQGGRLRGMLSGGKESYLSPREQTNRGLRNFDKLDAQGKRDLIGRLQASGQTSLAGQLAAQLKDDLATQQQTQKLELNKKIVERLYPDAKWAADFAAQGVPLSTIKELTSDTNADRNATYKWAVDTYGAEEANKLKPVIMTGQVKPKDIPSLIPDDSISIASRQNVDYIDSEGKKQTAIILFGADGKTYDVQGNPVELPKNAQMSVVGRTAADVKFEMQSDGTLGAPLSDKHRNEIIEDINRSIALLNEVEEIGTEELENSLTYMGRFLRWTGGKSSQLGIGKLAESDNKALQAIGEWAEDLEDFGGEATMVIDKLAQYFNKKRHDITGAQSSIKELKELEQGLLSRKSSPNEAKARIAKIIKDERDAIARNQMLLKNNMLSWEYYTKPPTSSLDSSNVIGEEEQSVTPTSIINTALGLE